MTKDSHLAERRKRSVQQPHSLHLLRSPHRGRSIHSLHLLPDRQQHISRLNLHIHPLPHLLHQQPADVPEEMRTNWFHLRIRKDRIISLPVRYM